MRVRRSITAAGAAVVLGTTGTLAAPAAASVHSAAHTLKFTSVARKIVFFTKTTFTKTTFAEQDTDVSSPGKIIGFDEVHGTLGKTASRAGIAFALNGGFLDGTPKISRSTGAAAGRVTGEPAGSPERPERSPASQSPGTRRPSRSPTAPEARPP